MQQSKNQLYELVKDIKTKKEFEKEIQKRYLHYDSLFDEDTVALMYIDELGKNNQSITNIADIKAGSEYAIIGTVKNIYEPRTFTRKNGSAGKVVNIDIQDSTGNCRLVLWDNDVDQITDKNIKKGTTLKCINGYTKDGYSGLEINLGRWGMLEVLSNENIEYQDNITDEIKGILVQKDETKPFFKDTGEFGFVTTIVIQNNTEKKQITLWDEKVKEVQKYNIGDQLVLQNITVKQRNGKTELHANGACILHKS